MWSEENKKKKKRKEEAHSPSLPVIHNSSDVYHSTIGPQSKGMKSLI